MSRWTRHIYQPGLPLGEDGRRVTGSKEHIELSRRGAAEGMVLLKNENQTLPFAKGQKLALFGKGTVDYVKGGGGSGDVTVAYIRSLYEGLKIKEAEGKVEIFHDLVKFYEADIEDQYGRGYAPGMTKEPAVPEELMEAASAYTDTAVFTVCRFSGEGWDRQCAVTEEDVLWEDELIKAKRQKEIFPKGDFCLTDGELATLAEIKKRFAKIVVVLNIGGMMETAWIKEDDSVSSALLAWQGGMEGGLAASDLLCGDETPSGKLVDTFAARLEDYPSSYNFHDSKDYVEYTDDIYVGYRYFETIPGAAEKVVYPFGYGLSYTDFEIKELKSEIAENEIQVTVQVTNTGDYAGKEVVQLYYSAPDGLLGKPAKELGAFKKTGKLNPGESEELTLVMDAEQMSSYDDIGKVQKSAWVLEKGVYHFYVGNSVRNVDELSLSYGLEENQVTEQLSEKIAPSRLSERLRSDGSMEKVPAGVDKSLTSMFPRKPLKVSEAVAPEEKAKARHYIYEKPVHTLEEVADGKLSLDEFMKGLSVAEKIHLLGGQKNHGISNTFGIGDLMEHGIPEITTADGPAGLRILPEVGVKTTAWPCATMLACSFNPALASQIGEAVAKEVKENNIGVWLAPAINIHRSPLCGRNFEYYSEDPLVAGLMGCGMVLGVQSQKVAATVKHFAFNNKETNRKLSDSRVSERAAREIYLKAFEIIVKEAAPWAIMTSYNKVNGIQCSECEELLNGILRDQWGYDGMVMTDWWTSGEHYLEAKAGNDLKMANGYDDLVMEAYEKGAITEDEIDACVRNILKLLMRIE